MLQRIINSQLSPLVERLAELEAEIDDLHRRADSFIRIGTCAEVDEGANTCKVTHGDLLTPLVKFFNPSAGEQSESRIPSLGEQCLLLNYGGGDSGGQSVALFGLNTDKYPPASDKATKTRRTHKDGAESSYDHESHALNWQNAQTAFKASRESAEFAVGAATVKVSPSSIELSIGAASIVIDAGGVHLKGIKVDHNGVNIGFDHVHADTMPMSGAVSGPPVPA